METMASRTSGSSAADTITLLQRGLASRILIELKSDTNLEQLQTALASNVSVKHADLFFAKSLEEKTQQECLALIQTVSSRPNLQRISLTSEEFSSYSLPITMLSELLTLSATITAIQLGTIALSGTVHDFATLAESFRNQPTLKELRACCWLSEETRMNGMTLDPLVQAMATSRSLESIYFHPTFLLSSGGSTEVLSSATLGMLCTCPNLRVLNIGNCNLNDDHVTAMAITTLAAQHDSVLTELHLTTGLAERGSRALADCLRANTTKLTALSIFNTTVDDTDGTSDDSEVDSNNGGGDDAEDYHAHMARALQVNQSLQHFVLHGRKLTMGSQKAFVEMMRKNCTLERISLVELEDDIQAEMDMFTRLNRCGRKRLLQQLNNETPERRLDWIDTMSLVSNELDCLFYLLSIKPSLCELPTPSGSHSAASTRVGSMKRSPGEDSYPKGKRAKTN